jgi:hypothetical protein
MKADQLNEFDKKDFQDNEAHNLHSENAVEIAKAFGTPEEVEAMERIMDQHMRRGHILPDEVEERNALVRKYYSMLESSVNPTFRSTLEGYKVLPPMDKEKYQARDGLEGPFSTLSGKVVYYDPKAGSYYDPDTDMYISYDDFQKLDNDYSDMKEEETVEESDQDFSGKERNFIHDLCMMHDGVKRDPAGLRYLGTSEMWDEGNCLSDKGKLTTLMLWVKKNKDAVEKRFSRKFGNYSNRDENGKVTASDGNQLLNDIISKIGSIGEETVKGPRGHLSSIVADDLNEIDCWDGYRKDGTKPGTGKNKGKRVNNCVKEAGGYYTQPIYDMIKQHGYPKVMHKLLTSLDADVIQDFISRADLDEASLNELGFSAPVGAAGKTSGYAPPSTNTISSRSSLSAKQKRDGSQSEIFTQYADNFQHDGADRGRSTMSDVSIQKYDADGNMTKNDTYNRFVMPGGAGIDSTNGVTKNIQMKGPQSWAYDKPKLSRIKREGKYVSDAQRKAVHASKAEKK